MPEVNFAREREKREQELGLNHNLWCAVESPQGGSRANGRFLACGQTWRRNFGMCIYMEKHALYYAPVIVHVLL